MPGRSLSDEAYVIDLCDEAVGTPALRQHRFVRRVACRLAHFLARVKLLPLTPGTPPIGRRLKKGQLGLSQQPGAQVSTDVRPWADSCPFFYPGAPNTWAGEWPRLCGCVSVWGRGRPRILARVRDSARPRGQFVHPWAPFVVGGHTLPPT